MHGIALAKSVGIFALKKTARGWSGELGAMRYLFTPQAELDFTPDLYRKKITSSQELLDTGYANQQ